MSFYKHVHVHLVRCLPLTNDAEIKRMCVKSELPFRTTPAVQQQTQKCLTTE